MTELKVGTRGKIDNTIRGVVVREGVDSAGRIVVLGHDDMYCTPNVSRFTPDPEPPTTVMVEMKFDAARWVAENADDETAEAAVEALKKAGL